MPWIHFPAPEAEVLSHPTRRALGFERWVAQQSALSAILRKLPQDSLLRVHFQRPDLHLLAIPLLETVEVETPAAFAHQSLPTPPTCLIYQQQGTRLRRLHAVWFKDLVPDWSVLLRAQYRLQPPEWRLLEGG